MTSYPLPRSSENSPGRAVSVFLYGHGFVSVAAPGGRRVCGRPVRLLGRVLFAVVLDEQRRSSPASLAAPVWIGYYDGPDLEEMRLEERYANVVEFLERRWTSLLKPYSPRVCCPAEAARLSGRGGDGSGLIVPGPPPSDFDAS